MKRQRINLWLEQALAEWLGPRVLAVTQPVAERWGMLTARAGRSSRPLSSVFIFRLQ